MKQEVFGEDHVGEKEGFLPDQAGLFSIFFFIFLVRFLGGRFLSDGDTLWHIRAGEIMIQKGELLTRDIFSHTAYGKPWIAHEWLSEVIMGALHQWGGLSAVTLFYMLLVVLTFWLLFKIAERIAGPWIALLCVSAAFVLALSHMLARPHIFSWIFGVLTLYLLLRNDRTLYLLVPLTALWSNLHGGVLLGPALQGIFLIGSLLDRRNEIGLDFRKLMQENRRHFIVLFLSIAALGLNPFGFHLIAFHSQVTGEVFIEHIGEWRSPNFQEAWYFRFYLLATILVLTIPRSRTNWTDRLLMIFFINASLIHQRHISLAALFLTPFWARNLKIFTSQISVRRKTFRDPEKELILSKRTGVFFTIGIAFCLLGTSGTAFGKKYLAAHFPLPETYSQAAIDYLENSPPPGNMFNHYEWGDYLIYGLNPNVKVFIDGRADMYGEEIFEDYIRIKQLHSETDDLLENYEIDWVIFPVNQPIVYYLNKNPGWYKVYSDDKVIILKRNEAFS